MSIKKLLHEYGIPYVAEGHKHSTPNWVNIHCPFCVGSKNYHLGISITQPAVSHCWRCGGHSTITVLAKVLGLPTEKAKALLRKYAPRTTQVGRRQEPRVNINPIKYPTPYSDLDERGKDYLAGRGFDPDKLIRVWKLKQTGPVSFLDGIPYRNRIIIPILWRGELVSFQTRDITRKADRKYLACPMKREAVHHKNILYGKQKGWNRYPALVVVEGVFDVWRLGPCAAATFGTSIKMEQVLALAKSHDRFFVVFDNESQAQGEARKLAVKLKALGKIVFIETVKTDPGDMDQSEADYFIKYLLGGNQM